jgi:hypothetical protein
MAARRVLDSAAKLETSATALTTGSGWTKDEKRPSQAAKPCRCLYVLLY